MFGLFLLEVLGHFVLLAPLRFEKGTRRGHRLDDVAVRGGVVDEVQQVPHLCLDGVLTRSGLSRGGEDTHPVSPGAPLSFRTALN